MMNAKWLVLSAAGVLLAACGGDDYEYLGPPAGSQALVQVMNTSPDAPPMTLLIDGSQASGTLGYGQGTGELDLTAGSHTVTLQGLSPSAPTTLVNLPDQTFAAGTVYRIVAEGPVASVAPVVYTYTASVIGANATRLAFVHAAPSAPRVDIYVTAPAAALGSSKPFTTLSYQKDGGPGDITAGTYEIRITPAGALSPVLYDSGSLTLVPGVNLLMAVVPNVGLGSAPVQLMAVDQNGDNSFLPDASTPAGLRIVHDVANGPAISVYTNGSTTPFVQSMSYMGSCPSPTAYTDVTPQSLSVKVTPASNPSQSLLTLDLNLEGGDERTLYAIGPLASIQPLVTHDHNRRVATYGKLRLIHGAPSAGPVDIYLLPTGSSIATASPTYASVPLGADTDFQPVAAGAYALAITAAGSKTPVLGPKTVTLADGGIYTAVVIDANGGGNPPQLLALDDFFATPLPIIGVCGA